MLALFGAKDSEALEARLVQGDGPSARRLRHLAATLPIGEPSRLEQIRLVVNRRPIGVNLRCVRTAGPGGATWLLASAPALGAASDEPPAAAKDREIPPPEDMSAPDLREKPAPYGLSMPSPNTRFLWTLDEEGRFGAPHPVLVAAVGANAPEHGESIETLFRRVGLDRGDELTRVLGERETFSRVAVEWPVAGSDRHRLIALSAAPMFGRQREFLGLSRLWRVGGGDRDPRCVRGQWADGACGRPCICAARGVRGRADASDEQAWKPRPRRTKALRGRSN